MITKLMSATHFLTSGGISMRPCLWLWFFLKTHSSMRIILHSHEAFRCPEWFHRHFSTLFMNKNHLLIYSHLLIDAHYLIELEFPHELKDRNWFFFKDTPVNPKVVEWSEIFRRITISKDLYHLLEVNSFIRWVSSRCHSSRISDNRNWKAVKNLSTPSISCLSEDSESLTIPNRFDYHSSISVLVIDWSDYLFQKVKLNVTTSNQIARVIFASILATKPLHRNWVRTFITLF
jgi:hypothetical protein